MKYVILHDCGLNGAAIEPPRLFNTETAAKRCAEELFTRDNNHQVPHGGGIIHTTGYAGWEIVELKEPA